MPGEPPHILQWKISAAITDASDRLLRRAGRLHFLRATKHGHTFNRNHACSGCGMNTKDYYLKGRNSLEPCDRLLEGVIDAG